jgi:hypothetical protein
MKTVAALIILAAILGPVSAAAQDSQGSAPREGRPVRIQALRVEQGPKLDGRLDDEAWREAPVFSGFRMAVPRSGAEPSERTELRVVYDGSVLYIGVLCLDGEPRNISANSMAHDGDDIEEAGEDAVRLILDPFQDRRNAYFFSVNPRGARSEGLATGEHSSLDWDGLWDARSAIGPDGWATEIAIPFKSISFKPGLESWGLNVERVVARRQEIDRLSGARADVFFTNPAEAAPLTGLGGIRQGLGLTFKPYGLLNPSKDHTAGTPADWRWDGGFDLYKNITPNLVGAFSYNTDFAETEVDERQINLSRFSLYFPEKRAFFLEGSEIFNFGTTMPGNGSGFAPFFSRRIGLFEGRQVPISFGTKVFGKIGDTNLQILDVRTGASESLGLPAENFLVARVSQNIWAESRVGAIFTAGSPTGARNSLAGFDFVYQTSRFLKDKNFLAGGWLVYNWNDRTEGRKEGFGFKIDYPNDLWDIVTSFNSYGDALDPGVGYLPARPPVLLRGLRLLHLGPRRPARDAPSLHRASQPADRKRRAIRVQHRPELRRATRGLGGRGRGRPAARRVHLHELRGPVRDGQPPRLGRARRMGVRPVLLRPLRQRRSRVPGQAQGLRDLRPRRQLRARPAPRRDLQGERLPAQGRSLSLAAARPDELRPVRRRLERARPQHALPLGDQAGQRRLPRLLEELGAALGPGVAVLSSRGTGDLQDHAQHPPLSRLAGRGRNRPPV